ncbi:hypothetical protein Tco_0951678 [Tanacetum coccineum]|uniref:No apical meristem-associated C-terminal domain-containing protein n=1 Tax=Tanacetum coccineum TaxID=301880 RepID=A0ABQ5DWM1_9ASTR
MSKKQPLVDLDEDDDDDVKEKRANTPLESGRRNLANRELGRTLSKRHGENDADHIENAKNTYVERYGNKMFQYVHSWNILKSYLKWDVVKPIDEDNLAELFGPDPRARPAGKPRPLKKQKSMDTSSAEGSTGGSQSESITGVLSQDYRRKCEAAEAAYEAKGQKELGLLECRELSFS